MSRRRRQRVWRGALAALLVGGGVLAARLPPLNDEIEHHAHGLTSVAAEAAARLDAARQGAVRSPEDSATDAFLTEREVLREVQQRHGLTSPVYTLRRTDDGATAFVVMTNPAPFVGDRYELRPEMRAVFDGAERRAHTGLYGDAHGRWISGYAAIPHPDGRVAALVSVDRPSDDLAARRTQAGVLAALLSLVAGLLAAWVDVGAWLHVGPVRLARRWLFGSLSTRIGLVGSVAVVLAVGVLGVLDHEQARTELVEHGKAELVQAVQLGALLIDPSLHTAVAESGDAESAAFEQLQRQLRRVKHAAGLDSPLYTLRQDGDLARFVGMTNEVPFVGDPNELRPGVRQTLQGGGVGTDGPYTDAHGTWLSAWAPLVDADGHVVGVLQADHDVGASMMALNNRALLRALFALAGALVAFLAAAVLARSVARPVRAVADAAREVGQGSYDITVPTDRLDEVGDLARAVHQMAAGLQERERLRDLFGKYMATQVVSDLLETGEVSLAGELREVTVLITDIRGYTALTEELGAAEVVGLLNSYFSVLIDVVLEHNGVIDKFMGDALLCWFGAPVPQEDHAARALSAADAILRRTAAWNAERVQRGLQPVATGIGVALGKVVVGNIGSPQRLEYTAIGDAVNLASRLCGQAGAGEVLLSGPVREAAGNPPHGGVFEPMGPVRVKGVREPVDVHRMRVPVVEAA